MYFDFIDVAATLARAVKEDNKRPFFFRVFLVIFWEGEKVIQLMRFRFFSLKSDGFLISTGRKTGEQCDDRYDRIYGKGR